MDKQKIRQRLLSQKQTLLERVEKTHKHIHKREKPVSPIFSEQSVEMESQQLILALDAEGREDIRKIDRALQRLDENEYGICTSCGEPIAEERLKALPATEMCIDCASEGRNHD